MEKEWSVSLEAYGFPREILHDYPLHLRQIQPLRKVLYLLTAEGEFVLKRFLFGEAALRFSLAAMDHLTKSGFCGVPRILETHNGEAYCVIEGIPYFIMSFQRGEESDYRRSDHLTLATRALAELHNKSRGFSPPSAPGKIQYGTWIGHFRERLRQMEEYVALAKEEDSPFAHMYREAGAYGIYEAERAIEQLCASPYLELSEQAQIEGEFCHHDYAHHNVLIDEGSAVSVVDFDYAICDIRSHDLASLLLRNMKRSGWNGRLAQKILHHYHECSPLRTGEMELLSAMLRFPQEVWEAGYFYYGKKKKPSGKWEKRLQHWLDLRLQRAEFLRDFEQRAKHTGERAWIS